MNGLRGCVRLLGVLVLVLATQSPARAQLDNNTYNRLIQSCLAAYDAGRYQDAERYALAIKADDERFTPSNFVWRLFLGLAYMGQGRYKEAQPLLESYVELCRKHKGEGAITVEGLLSLGGNYLKLEMLAEAQPILEEAVAMAKRSLGPDNGTTLTAQTNMAALYQQRGDLQRAAELFRDTIDRQHRQNLRDVVRLKTIYNLMLVYQAQGRFDQVDAIARYGLGVAKWLNAGTDHPDVIGIMHLLGSSYRLQNRALEAVPILERALTDGERVLGSEHPDLGRMCADLASCYTDLRETEKGNALQQRAIKILTAALGPDHPAIALQYFNLGWDYWMAGRFADAEQALRHALKINEAACGPHHHRTAEARIMLSDALLAQDKLDKLDEVESQLKLALAVSDGQGLNKVRRHEAQQTLARVAWKRGDKAAAVAKMQQALDLADESRAFAAGADVERAAFFHRFVYSYQLLLRWQAELGQHEDALVTMERIRARTFLESMNQSGVDLLDGVAPEEKARTQHRQAELRGRVSLLENAWNELPAPSADEDPAVGQKRIDAERAVTAARDALYQFERNLRSSSRAYRQLISTQPKLPTAAEVQKQLVPEKSLLINYFVGDDESFILVVRPTGVRLIELKVSAEDAATLGMQAGPLTHEGLQQALQGDAKTGVLGQLSQPEMSEELLKKLHSLWHVLIPSEVREEIASGKLDRLIVIPEGPVTLLPMETLVVEQSPDLKYLLDVAPPIQYGPSASVLMALSERAKISSTRQPVLTLGDPQYPAPKIASEPTDLLTAASTGSRSASMRQSLKSLPHSGMESRWVSDVFKESGFESVELLRESATEAQIRANITGREIIHLACHGLTDDAHGNFFGMLVLAPGAQAGNPQDDGMLTLAEIYGLDLRGCELAILSACRTNHGPEQSGEGVWSLSRGFLVAGAKRVVASNWLVDDEASASLISVFCSDVAKEQKSGHADYAAALRKAKRWTRQQDKWKSPYYWGAFVLLGPN